MFERALRRHLRSTGLVALLGGVGCPLVEAPPAREPAKEPEPKPTPPTAVLSANPVVVSSGEASTLVWSSTDATSAAVSGGWSGVRALSGTESTGALVATTTYTLSVAGPGGSADASVTVTVTPAPPPPPPDGQHGLDWSGEGSVRRMLYWPSPPAAYDTTYFFKVYQRDQVADAHRYYTTFFHGHNGPFVWGGAYDSSYYGAHPYPIPAPGGDGKWEISANGNDFVTRDDGSSPFVINDRWYSQAFRAHDTGAGGNDHEQRFYIDLPSVTAADRISHATDGYQSPPNPIVCMGQAPDNGSGQSWGGYNRWEEQNAIIRGIQIYTEALPETHIVALAAMETDAEVLAYCSAAGITSLWYLNMNPRPLDVSDKSGQAHHPLWEGDARPGEWTP